MHESKTIHASRMGFTYMRVNEEERKRGFENPRVDSQAKQNDATQ
jgi:hypothetical protein